MVRDVSTHSHVVLKFVQWAKYFCTFCTTHTTFTLEWSLSHHCSPYKQLGKGIYAIFQISNHFINQNHQRQKTANTSSSLGWEIHDKSVIYSHKKSEKISHRNCADSARRALPAQTKINVVSDPAAYFPKEIFDHRPLCCCLLGCGLWSKIINHT